MEEKHATNSEKMTHIKKKREENGMKDKKSLLCGVIYKKDLTRFWPVWTLELLFLLLSVILPMQSKLRALKMEHSSVQYYGTACFMRGPELDWGFKHCIKEYGTVLNNSFVIALFSLVVALFLFSYLYKTREAYSMHSLPMKREQLFFEHYLAGLTMLIVPFLLAYVILICMGLWCRAEVTMGLLIQFLITLVEIIFFYNLACCIAMVTANGIMTASIYVVSNVLYQGVARMFLYMGSMCIYGYQGDESQYAGTIGRYLTPLAFFAGKASIFDVINQYIYPAESRNYMNYQEIWEEWQLWDGPGLKQSLWYLIPAVLLIGLAVVLYKKRSLECAGNMMAFPWGRLVFQMVFTMCGSMIFTLLIYRICFSWNQDSLSYGALFKIYLVLMLVGSVVSYFVSNMILHKSFFIWKKISYGRMLLFSLAIIVAFVYMKYGYGTGIPSTEKVEFVEMEAPASGSYARNTYYITGEEQIQEMQELHKNILKYGESCRNKEVKNPKVLGITYYLEGKQKVSRFYPVYDLDMKEVGVVDFLSDTEGICSRVFTPAYEEVKCESVSIVNEAGGIIYSYSYSEFSERQIMGEFYEAAVKDLQEGNMLLGAYRQEAPYHIKISYVLGDEFRGKYNLPLEFTEGEEQRQNAVYLPITSKSKHVKQLMKELDWSEYSWVE